MAGVVRTLHASNTLSFGIRGAMILTVPSSSGRLLADPDGPRYGGEEVVGLDPLSLPVVRGGLAIELVAAR